MVVGHGDFTYRIVEGWGKGPEGRKLGVASGLAVDSQDRVYVVDREPNPAIVVFDRDGHFLTSWGEEIFPLPHAIWIDAEDRLYIADCADHTVRICTTDGEVLKTLGTPGEVGAPGEPFNQPTRAAVAPSGEIYVSDGYGQHQVHRFSADGTLLQTWGKQGSAPGQFTLPHSIFVSQDGRVWVADREANNRIQIFDAEGRFLDQWWGRLFPCDLFVDPDGTVYVAENVGVSVFNQEGRLMAVCPARGGPDNVNHGAHAVWVDRHGDIYLGEVGAENLIHKFARL